MGTYNIEDVNELTSAKITASFSDEDGDPVIPSKVYYKITDVASGTVVVAKTEVTGPLSADQEILITSAQNAILVATNKFELRLVTVQFEYGESRVGTGDYQYRLKNLSGVPL